MYYQVWKNFNQFFIRLNNKPYNWENRIVLFVGYLIETNKKSQTIKSYISAIHSVLARDGIFLNENKFLLTSLTQACQLKDDRVQIKLPIRKGLVQLLVSSVDRLFMDAPQPYLKVMYKTLFTIAYFGLFRIGELTKGDHVVKAKDVHLGNNKQKNMLVLHLSKTHGEGKKPQIVKIKARRQSTQQLHSNDELCLVTMLESYVHIWKRIKTHDKQFFVFKDRSLVQPTHARIILNKLLWLNGLDPQLYNFSGFRSGQATDLLDVYHLSLETVSKIGCWKSTTVYAYLKA